MSRKALGLRLVNCKQCNKEYPYDRKHRKGGSSTLCPACSVANRRRKLKEMAIEYKGGKCQICGYNKCKRALNFHHTDPTQKSFGIGSKGHTRSWDNLKTELDKCILLCANCHMEVEDSMYQHGLMI